MPPAPDPSANPELPPSWQDQPCPTWCIQAHQEDDFPEDRKHQSQVATVPTVWLDHGTSASAPDELVAGDLHLSAWRRIDCGETMISIADGEYEVCLEVTAESMSRIHRSLRELLNKLD